MDKKAILDDLSGRFGRKVLLTPCDIAGVIAQSPGAQAVARHRRAFDIPVRRRGNRVLVSVYDLADWLAGEKAERGAAVAPPQESAKPAVRRATNRPSIGKDLLRQMLSTLRDEAEFKSQLYAALESVALDAEAKAPDRKASGKPRRM